MKTSLAVTLLSLFLQSAHSFAAPKGNPNAYISRGSNFQVPLGSYLTPISSLLFIIGSQIELQDPFLRLVTQTTALYTLLGYASEAYQIPGLSQVQNAPRPPPTVRCLLGSGATESVLTTLKTSPVPLTFVSPSLQVTTSPAPPSTSTLESLRKSVAGTSGDIRVEGKGGEVYGVYATADSVEEGKGAAWVREGRDVESEVKSLIESCERSQYIVI